MSEITIYAIINPVTATPVYIGKSKNLPQRIKNHLANTSFKHNYDLWDWIVEMRDNDIIPEFKQVHICIDEQEAIIKERFYIKWYAIKHKLYNKINNKQL